MGSDFLPPWMKRAEAEEEKGQALEEEYVQDIVARQTAHYELLKDKEPYSAYDPSLPFDPILNAPPREETPGWILAMRSELSRARCTQKQYDQALALVKAGTFRSRKELAQHFNRPKDWGYAVVRVMTKWADIPQDEIKRLLPGIKGTKRT